LFVLRREQEKADFLLVLVSKEKEREREREEWECETKQSTLKECGDLWRRRKVLEKDTEKSSKRDAADESSKVRR